MTDAYKDPRSNVSVLVTHCLQALSNSVRLFNLLINFFNLLITAAALACNALELERL